MADKVLDAKGLNCPLPILKAKKALKEVPDGGTLEILKPLDERLLFADTSPAAMAERIEYFLDRPGEIRALRPRCRGAAC